MASTVASVDTHHEDMIHDIQLDYYGKRMATCSSDRTIKIFDVTDSGTTQVAEIRGHEAPVWQVCWAHPKFGSILASCSYDKKVIVWKETSSNNWSKLYEFDKHQSSVNSISWAPHEFGLMLACASSDSKISVIQYKDNSWTFEQFHAHDIGTNCVSWAPAFASGSLLQTSNNAQIPLTKKLVSGGCDNLVKVWAWSDSEKEWKLEAELKHHTDWVRDVAWAPSIGLPSSTIASCSQDGDVVIWTKDSQSANWNKKLLSKFPDVVWRVSWSVVGNILAVSGGDNKVSLWKESVQDSTWKCISSLDDVPESSS